jgi:undecaprenyl-diphosphatase
MIESLNALDRSLFLAINSWHSEWINPLMVFFSGQIIWLPLIMIALWIAFKQLGVKGFSLFFLFLILTIIASDVFSSYILKNSFNRLRPCRVIDLKPFIYQFGQKCGGKFGFVSSHAANSVAVVFFTLRILPFKSYSIYLLWLLPFIVSYSRIYLGVHYPGDVIFGAMVGIFWAFLFSWIFKRTRFMEQV